MRKIVAIIEVDEEFAEQCAEQNDMEYPGPLDWLIQESGWMESSGIKISDAFVSDYDDESVWWRYLDYLSDWIFENHDEDHKENSPMSFTAWNNQYKDE